MKPLKRPVAGRVPAPGLSAEELESLRTDIVVSLRAKRRRLERLDRLLAASSPSVDDVLPAGVAYATERAVMASAQRLRQV